MSIFQMNANDIANAQGRSPAWLFDGDLMTGKVPSGCQMRPSMPGNSAGCATRYIRNFCLSSMICCS